MITPLWTSKIEFKLSELLRILIRKSIHYLYEKLQKLLSVLYQTKRRVIDKMAWDRFTNTETTTHFTLLVLGRPLVYLFIATLLFS